MPHVNIKHHPRDFTDTQKKQLADAITTVTTEHFDIYEGAVSIALEPVAPADWSQVVELPEITGRQHRLIKAPNYRTD